MARSRPEGWTRPLHRYRRTAPHPASDLTERGVARVFSRNQRCPEAIGLIEVWRDAQVSPDPGSGAWLRAGVSRIVGLTMP